MGASARLEDRRKQRAAAREEADDADKAIEAAHSRRRRHQQQEDAATAASDAGNLFEPSPFKPAPSKSRRTVAPLEALPPSADDGPSAPSFSLAHTRAARALSMVSRGEGNADNQRALLEGLKRLAEREPAIDSKALAARANREKTKLSWALPALDEPEVLRALGACGFSHRDALITHFKDELDGDAVDDREIAAAFRQAVKQLKAGLIGTNAGLEAVVLRKLRSPGQ